MSWLTASILIGVLAALLGAWLWALWVGGLVFPDESDDDTEPVYSLKSEAEWREYWTRKRE